MRRLKVYEKHISYKRNVPQIVLQGEWLKEFCAPGDEITIEVNDKTIIIKNISK